jgi:hypothetical protein
MPIVPALWRLREKDHKLEASLDIARFCPKKKKKLCWTFYKEG